LCVEMYDIWTGLENYYKCVGKANNAPILCFYLGANVSLVDVETFEDPVMYLYDSKSVKVH
jgi:hypothetical protein